LARLTRGDTNSAFDLRTIKALLLNWRGEAIELDKFKFLRPLTRATARRGECFEFLRTTCRGRQSNFVSTTVSLGGHASAHCQHKFHHRLERLDLAPTLAVHRSTPSGIIILTCRTAWMARNSPATTTLVWEPA